MAEKIRVRLKSATVQPLETTMPVPAIVQGGSSINVSDIPKKDGRDAFSTGGAYLLQSQIDKKANKDDIPTIPDIPTVPTKVSELENDSEFVSEENLNKRGFLTDEDIRKKDFVTGTALANTLLDYAKTKDIPSVEGLASENYVNGIVGDINRVLDQINGEVI
jgi:hypothetical protein